MMYKIIVSNIGMVAEGDKFMDVYSTYLEYVSMSQDSIGSASGEDVTLLCNGEPIREFWGSLHDDDEIDGVQQSVSLSEYTYTPPDIAALMRDAYKAVTE